MCNWEKVKWLDNIQHKSPLHIYRFLTTLSRQEKIEFEKLYRISKKISERGF